MGNPRKIDDGEFGDFTRLLDKLLTITYSKIKAELEAEKTRTKASLLCRNCFTAGGMAR